MQKIQQGYDLVMGNRFAGGIMPGAMPAVHRYLGNPVLSWVARRSFGVPIRDFHCGMRAFTRQAFEKMMLQTPGMEFATEMVANAAHQGLRIGEIPIVLHPDKRGRPPHLAIVPGRRRHLRFIHLRARLYVPCTWDPDAAGRSRPAGSLGHGTSNHRRPVSGHPFPRPWLPAGAGGLQHLQPRCFRQDSACTALRWLPESHRALGGPALLIGCRNRGRGLLLLAGTTVDGAILYRWLSHPGMPMDSTVHPAFVATSAMALGINIIVSSLLLNLIVSRGRSGESVPPKRRPGPGRTS